MFVRVFTLDYYVILLISIRFCVLLLSIVETEIIEVLNVVLIARIIPKFMQLKKKFMQIEVIYIYIHTYHPKCLILCTYTVEICSRYVRGVIVHIVSCMFLKLN